MHLYHHPLSSNSRRVMMTALHLGLKLDLTEINLGSPDDRRRLAEVNPNGKVPVLVHGDFVLWESCAIMQYMAELTPGQTACPQDPQAKADVNRWLFWASQHFATAIAVFTWENVWKKFVEGTGPDAAELARGSAELAPLAEVLDRHLAHREWLVGDTVTMADYAVAAPLMYTERASVPVTQYPNVQRWFARVQQLPVWQHTNPVW
ncbi:glutathione S-transferase family protein [Massilia endophytica]|uniref:glutathione S-transferase family protein n=1 Tax=Massilia endophytica TaxID=2899220 RepID=UPI001E47A3DF|nr:glutathione S-transferase family protein [Massilia endophytica]UGQ46029.1 glutathione S-transferase family protein [Massilia endophytica]